MTNLMRKIGVCALVVAMQTGLGYAAVIAAPVKPELQTIAQQEAESLELKQQEIWRHEKAMLRLENESETDWQWRQWLEREQHILNMQKLQRDGMVFIGTPVNW